MIRTRMVLRPATLAAAACALANSGAENIVAENVRGHGRQLGHTLGYRGSEYAIHLLPKVMLSASIEDASVGLAIDHLRATINDGKIGAGVLWCIPIEPANITRPVSAFELTAIIRPHNVDATVDALAHTAGITVQEVVGLGGTRGDSELLAGPEFARSFIRKVRVLTLVPAGWIDTAIDAISNVNRTGNMGDGKIWTRPLVEYRRLRTDERELSD